MTVVDGKDQDALAISDYRWIIEEDRTFYIDPVHDNHRQQFRQPAASFHLWDEFPHQLHAGGGDGLHGAAVLRIGPDVSGSSTGTHVPAVCDVGNGVCRTDAHNRRRCNPSQVIWIRPSATTSRFCRVTRPTRSTPESRQGGHGMGGCTDRRWTDSVTVMVEPTPLPPAKLSVFVFEDDFPLNGEHDAGGGVDVLVAQRARPGRLQHHPL